MPKRQESKRDGHEPSQGHSILSETAYNIGLTRKTWQVWNDQGVIWTLKEKQSGRIQTQDRISTGLGTKEEGVELLRRQGRRFSVNTPEERARGELNWGLLEARLSLSVGGTPVSLL